MSFIKSIPLTFYSRSFYADLIGKGKGIGVGFILLLVVLSMLPFTLSLPSLLTHAPTKVEGFFGRFPDVTIKDRKLSIDRTSPYAVPFDASDEKVGVIVFDTTPRELQAQDLSKEMEDRHIVALVTSDFIAMRKNDAVEIHNFSEYKSWTNDQAFVGHDQWIAFGHKLLIWGIPIMAVVMIVSLLVWKFISTFVKAVAVQIASLFFALKPDFAASMRLAAAAALPPAALDFLLAVVNQLAAKPVGLLPFWLALLVWAGFALFGLRAFNAEVKHSQG